MTNVDKANINNTDICFSAYNKKPEFGGCYIRYKNLNSSCYDKINFDKNFINH